jgi:hypothetical protein
MHVLPQHDLECRPSAEAGTASRHVRLGLTVLRHAYPEFATVDVPRGTMEFIEK